MFFVYNPQVPQYTYDPEEIYQEYRRREYIAALQEQQRRVQFERELVLEEERHRRALALLARQEAARHQLQASRRFAPRRPHQHVPGACVCGDAPDDCIMPDSQEIFRRRLARQQEEEDRSRDFHREILTRIFGIPSGDDALTTDDTSENETEDRSPVPIAATEARSNRPVANNPNTNEPSASAVGNAPVKPTAKAATANEPSAAKNTTAKSVTVEESMSGNQQTDESESHWSAAPERARSLAEIAAANRTFASLKNTFVFPSGPLEAVVDGTTPRLAYNGTNAAVHAYQHSLGDLLSQLDCIESFGFQGVREARKQLVVKIEQEMEELERMINERLTGSAAPTTDQSNIPDAKDNQDVVIGDTEEQATISTDATAANVIPEASVATDASLHKDSEDVTMHKTVDSSTRDVAEVDTAAGPDKTQPEELTTASTPLLTEAVGSTALEPLESQASLKEAVEADASMPAPSDANPTAAPINSSKPISASIKPKAPTFSVSDEEEWEIEDAVKTVA